MRQNTSLSEDLLLEVRRALTHVYDAIYMQRSPLVTWLGLDSLCDAVPGQEPKALRKVLLEAIEELAPGENMPLRSQERRAYEVLHGRYVDQMSVAELAASQGISERQVQRELRAGLEAVVTVVARKIAQGPSKTEPAGARPPMAEQEPQGDAEDSLIQVRTDLESLGSDVEPVNICSEVRNVEALVTPLAQSAGVRLMDGDLLESLIVRVSRVVLRQVMLALYSWCIQHQQGGTISSTVSWNGEKDMLLELSCAPETGASTVPPGPAVVPPDLLEASQGVLQSTLLPDGRLALQLILPRMPMYAVLLIDDNLGIHRLFKRYLSGFPYRLLAVADAAAGLALAREERPAVIVLDIMMPGQDGWELLNALRADPVTHDIPIIVCTVLEQEALAKSLAVDGYIKKPLTQNALLSALRALSLRPLG